MSAARAGLQSAINALESAVSIDLLAGGATTTHESAGIGVLRRGIMITALIGLETFIRDRTAELLVELSVWPASFGNFPQKFREAALLNSLSHLQKYAAMLKRQQEDYESEIIAQIDLMAANKGPTFGFSKFIAGDYTGNISEQSITSLLSNFQITSCWEGFRGFSADIGFGIPSIKEAMNDLVRKRHRSAHASSYVPTASDIRELPSRLTCFGMCFDVAMTSSIRSAIHEWETWSENPIPWRDKIDIYFIDPRGGKFRLVKYGARKALRNTSLRNEARASVRSPVPGRVGVVIDRDDSLKPKSWTVV